MLSKILSGVSAGILICIGGSVFLACESRYVGAVLFTVALLCICFKGYSLYTGKVGFIPEAHGREEVSVLFGGLAGNVVATVLGGLAVAYALPALGDAAATICAAKLMQLPAQTFIRAVFCGVLMYLAVSIYRDKNSVLGIVFGIPVFILSGFEHSIADMFYFAAARSFSWETLAFIVIVLAGNSAGAMILPVLSSFGAKRS